MELTGWFDLLCVCASAHLACVLRQAQDAYQRANVLS